MDFEILGKPAIFFTATCNLCVRRLIERGQTKPEESIAGKAQF